MDAKVYTLYDKATGTTLKSWTPFKRSTCGLCGGSGKCSKGHACKRCDGAGGWG